MMRTSVDLLQGTLDLIVLKALSWRAMHGFGLARWIQLTTDSVLQVEEGSLYPALYHMDNRGWIKASWALDEKRRRAKYYKPTALTSPAGGDPCVSRALNPADATTTRPLFTSRLLLLSSWRKAYRAMLLV